MIFLREWERVLIYIFLPFKLSRTKSQKSLEIVKICSAAGEHMPPHGLLTSTLLALRSNLFFGRKKSTLQNSYGFLSKLLAGQASFLILSTPPLWVRLRPPPRFRPCRLSRAYSFAPRPCRPRAHLSHFHLTQSPRGFKRSAVPTEGAPRGRAERA